jgi:tRNA(adenine34) deaminase
MKKALEQAEEAMQNEEIPVGAIIVCNNRIIAKAHNQTEKLNDVTAHAEILAITSASAYLGSKYLKGCTLYVTLEPCAMCAGAIAWSQLEKVVFAASDPKKGFTTYAPNVINPKTKIEKGLLENQSRQLLNQFFSTLRNN